MICAPHYFTHLKNELPEFKLNLLLNIGDLNPSIFGEVFAVLTPQQQEQYLVFELSDAAAKYREERNAALPYIDFKHLPEVFDDDLLQKILLYQKDVAVREAVYDLLSEAHKDQIDRWNAELYEAKKAAKRALMSDEEKRKEQECWDNYNADPEPRFFGNMGEPDTVTGYILKYGVNPLTLKPETIESFHKQYTIDPKTGDSIPKDNNE